jgi:hypothetical protein
MPIIFIDRPGGNYWSMWQEYVEKQLLQRGLISPPDLALYKITDNVDEAAAEIRHFYSNFHSMRYTRDEVIVRLHRAPSDRELAEIAREFSDIKRSGEFRIAGPLPVERNEPLLNDLHRLVFTFNRRDHGRLRLLINRLNEIPER